jgi:two-component system chemotaxis response regulator CheB
VANRDIVVVGASAGGIDALCSIVRALPADLQAAVFAVVHTAPQGPRALADILTHLGGPRAVYASDGEFDHARIYLAPPDHHLLLDPPARMLVVRGPH